MQLASLALDPPEEIEPAWVAGLQVLLDNNGPCFVVPRLPSYWGMLLPLMAYFNDQVGGYDQPRVALSAGLDSRLGSGDCQEAELCSASRGPNQPVRSASGMGPSAGLAVLSLHGCGLAALSLHDCLPHETPLSPHQADHFCHWLSALQSASLTLLLRWSQGPCQNGPVSSSSRNVPRRLLGLP